MARSTKILLINPNWTGIERQKQPQFKRIWQPLDLAIAAALLESEGFSLEILDNNVERLSRKEIGTRTADFEKVFVTSTPYDRWQCPALDIGFFFNTISHVPSERLYVMGAHVTERPETILRECGARAAILNEPEQTILEIARRDLSPDLPPNIPGIAYFNDERFIRSSPRRYLDDLDQLPYPAFHLLPMDRYYYELMGRNFAIMEASRGCPFQCNFCYLGMYGTQFRQKSLERLMNEIAYVKKRFNVRNIYFMDLEFGLNRDYVLSFCDELIRQKMDIRWCCQTRVTDVDKEVLKWMRMSGCSLIHFGGEAGSDRILSRTGKGTSVSECISAVSEAHEAGIRTVLFMNFGFPHETIEEMEATIDLAIKLNPTFASFHLIVPFPGTGLAREVALDPEAFPASQYPHYNFAHHDLKTLKRMLRKAYLKFYLRPSYLKGFVGKPMRSGLNQARVLLRLITG